MSRFSWRGPTAPPRHYELETSLPEAKHHGWAHVTGERRPAGLPAPPRLHHRGFLDDLPLPEGPIRRRRLGPGEALRGFARALAMGPRKAAVPAPDAPAAEIGTVAGSFPADPAGERRPVPNPPAEAAAEPRLPSAA